MDQLSSRRTRGKGCLVELHEGFEEMTCAYRSSVANVVHLTSQFLRVQERLTACSERMKYSGENRDVAYTDSVTKRCQSLCVCAVVCVLLPVHFCAMSVQQEAPKKCFVTMASA